MLIPFALAWLAGLALLLILPDAAAPLLACAALLLLLRLTAPRWAQLHIVALCVAAAAAGALRLLASQHLFAPPDLSPLSGQELVLSGVLREEPRRSDRDQRVVLQLETVAPADTPHRSLAASGLIQLTLPAHPAFHYGQRLLLRGKPEVPASARSAGEFDYRAYLARRGIYLLLRNPREVQLLADAAPFDPLGRIAAAREHCRLVLLRILPEPQAALAVGILLGIQAGLPADLQQAFSVTGTSHILVVSGWNFSVAAAALAVVTRSLHLPRIPAFVLSLTVMWAYAVFTGASAAVLRAAAMASLALLATTFDRQAEAWRLLLGACLLITLVDPQAVADLGFQLSALATAGLFAYAAPIDSALQRLPLPDHPVTATLRETLSATLAAQVLTLPLLLYHFGSLSLIAPLANLIVVPVVPAAMAAGAAALIAGLCWLPLGQLLGLLAWLPLSWIRSAAVLLAAPAWAALQIPSFSALLLLPIYTLLTILTFRTVRRRSSTSCYDGPSSPQ